MSTSKGRVKRVASKSLTDLEREDERVKTVKRGAAKNLPDLEGEDERIKTAVDEAKQKEGERTMTHLRNFLFCSICLDVAPSNKRVMTACSHIFCRDCLDTAQQGPCRGRCPTCKEQFPLNAPNHAHKFRLGDAGEVTVRCSHKGCKWMGSYNNWETNHDEGCSFKQHPCDNAKHGCDFTGTRAEVTHHKNRICTKHPCTCHGTDCVGYGPLNVLKFGCPAVQLDKLRPYLKVESPSYDPRSFTPEYAPLSPGYNPIPNDDVPMFEADGGHHVPLDARFL